jgi:hypothetical protein
MGPTLHWLETELLATEENLIGLMAVNRDLIGQAETFDRADRIVLDMDSRESRVHGQQEGSAYNGHFDSVCYHPRCFCSTITVTVWRRSCDRTTSPARMTGRSYSCPISTASRRWDNGWRSAPTRPWRLGHLRPLDTRGAQYVVSVRANKNLELGKTS